MNPMTTNNKKKAVQADSYGPVFMYATHRDLATAPRHMIRMSEPVDPNLLQKAVELALIRFPQMKIGMTRGAHDYHYYYNDRPPVVLPFEDISPYHMGSADNNGYLFTVGYQDKTIYMEYQHSVADGHGFDQLIRSVLFEYLTLCGKPVENDGSIRTRETAFSPSECEDGYQKLDRADPSEEGHYTVDTSFHPQIPQARYDDSPELMTEVTFSFEEMHKWTKAHGVSPVSLLYTALSFAIYRTYYTEADRGTPIVAEVPMDLRQIVPSDTTRFFVALLDLPFEYEWFSLPFAEACAKVKEAFNTQRAPRHAAFWGQAGSRRVHEGHISAVSIDEKEQTMREMARNYIRRDSFILTNIGEFCLPESMCPYVEDYGAILPSAHQPFGVLVSSYQGTMKVSLAQKDESGSLRDYFCAELERCGIHTEQKNYAYHPTRYDGAKLMPEHQRAEAVCPNSKKAPPLRINRRMLKLAAASVMQIPAVIAANII